MAYSAFFYEDMKDVLHAGRKGMKRGYHIYGDRDYTPIGEKAQGPQEPVGDNRQAAGDPDAAARRREEELDAESKRRIQAADFDEQQRQQREQSITDDERQANENHRAVEAIKQKNKEDVKKALLMTAGIGLTAAVVGSIFIGKVNKEQRKNAEQAHEHSMDFQRLTGKQEFAKSKMEKGFDLKGKLSENKTELAKQKIMSKAEVDKQHETSWGEIGKAKYEAKGKIGEEREKSRGIIEKERLIQKGALDRQHQEVVDEQWGKDRDLKRTHKDMLWTDRYNARKNGSSAPAATPTPQAPASAPTPTSTPQTSSPGTKTPFFNGLKTKLAGLGNGVKKGAAAVGNGVQKGAAAVGNFAKNTAGPAIVKGAQAVGNGVQTGAQAAGTFMKNTWNDAADKVQRYTSGDIKKPSPGIPNVLPRFSNAQPTSNSPRSIRQDYGTTYELANDNFIKRNIDPNNPTFQENVQAVGEKAKGVGRNVWNKVASSTLRAHDSSMDNPTQTPSGMNISRPSMRTPAAEAKLGHPQTQAEAIAEKQRNDQGIQSQFGDRDTGDASIWRSPRENMEPVRWGSYDEAPMQQPKFVQSFNNARSKVSGFMNGVKGAKPYEPEPERYAASDAVFVDEEHIGRKPQPRQQYSPEEQAYYDEIRRRTGNAGTAANSVNEARERGWLVNKFGIRR